MRTALILGPTFTTKRVRAAAAEPRCLHRGPFNDANNSVYQIRINDSFSGPQVIDFTDTTGANGATIDPATQGGYQVNGDDGSASGGLYLVGPDTPDTTVVSTMTPLLANWNDATSQNHFTRHAISLTTTTRRKPATICRSNCVACGIHFCCRFRATLLLPTTTHMFGSTMSI